MAERYKSGEEYHTVDGAGGMSLEQIAAVEGITEYEVKKVLRRALGKLRRATVRGVSGTDIFRCWTRFEEEERGRRQPRGVWGE